MAFTKVVGPGIHTQSQLRTHNIHSSGIITASSFVGPLTASSGSSGIFDSLTITGNVSIGGTLQYEDVTNVESVGIITAKSGIKVPAGGLDVTGVGTFASLDISGNADIDGTMEADAYTVNGTALDTHIAGVTVTNATNSSHVLVTDNESTDENNLIAFVEGATSSTGNVGLEMDGNLTYNPSTGTLTATVFSGGLPITSGSSWRVVTSSDASTLKGETNLQFDGTNLYISDNIIHKDDTNTKIGFPAVDTITAETAGDERLRIDSSGNITQGIAGSATFSAINSISANAARGIEIFKDGTDTGSAIKLAGDNGSGTKAWSQLGYSGANATAHWANYNTSGTKLGEILIGSTGNIGIGDRTTSPDADLHVHTASGESTIHVEGATNANLNLRSHSGDSTVKFSDASASNVGNINYDHGTDSLSFRVNANPRFTITMDAKSFITICSK